MIGDLVEQAAFEVVIMACINSIVANPLLIKAFITRWSEWVEAQQRADLDGAIAVGVPAGNALGVPPLNVPLHGRRDADDRFVIANQVGVPCAVAAEAVRYDYVTVFRVAGDAQAVGASVEAGTHPVHPGELAVVNIEAAVRKHTEKEIDILFSVIADTICPDDFHINWPRELPSRRSFPPTPDIRAGGHLRQIGLPDTVGVS